MSACRNAYLLVERCSQIWHCVNILGGECQFNFVAAKDLAAIRKNAFNRTERNHGRHLVRPLAHRNAYPKILWINRAENFKKSISTLGEYFWEAEAVPFRLWVAWRPIRNKVLWRLIWISAEIKLSIFHFCDDFSGATPYGTWFSVCLLLSRWYSKLD